MILKKLVSKYDFDIQSQNPFDTNSPKEEWPINLSPSNFHPKFSTQTPPPVKLAAKTIKKGLMTHTITNPFRQILNTTLLTKED